jgi:diacylglycerol O-acyltransferase / wax synthase
MTNLHESNVIGPADPIRILGATLLDLVPVSVLSGNLTVAFLAFSYAQRLSITVLTDADQYPDLPVLMAAMRREWRALSTQS